ncbi:hypothetical protein HKBW3S42_02329, partial [Candidatus Hakubella thermalkaliphila]
STYEPINPTNQPTNQTDQIDETDEIDQTDQINQMEKTQNVRRGQLFCSHVYRNHSLLPFVITEIYFMISLTFS